MQAPKPHPLVELAQEAIHEYLSRRIVMPPPVSLAGAFSRPAGTFVCLKKNGQLRGCVGTYEPARATVAEEVVHNAIASATRDPRFSPVILPELKEIDCSVDILSIPVPTAAQDLDPRRLGILVVQGPRRGLLLPDLDGIQTAEQQIREAKQKAGIMTDEAVELYSFTVQRFR
ncbi:MAG TPA: AmmeMemoRadiSam system protein A [Nitrospiria bacterium]|jgi:AmmeMemoRadiSam system protein A|nr:AmmeMemoRadiSam system protein A [Nitrospiria bacterium]